MLLPTCYGFPIDLVQPDSFRACLSQTAAPRPWCGTWLRPRQCQAELNTNTRVLCAVLPLRSFGRRWVFSGAGTAPLAPGGCDLLRAQPIPAPLCLPGSFWLWSCALVSLRSEEPAAGLGWVSRSGLQTTCPISCQGGLNSAPVPGVTAALLSSLVLGFVPSCSFCKDQPRRTVPL